MSVYTKLSDAQFLHYCAEFGVDFGKALPITQGIKNSNWFIKTKDDIAQNNDASFVLTLFEERKPHEIEKMAQILNHLQHDLPVAAPKKTKRGEFMLYYDNKALLLSAKLAGDHPKHITNHMCAQMGKALAHLHQKLQSLTPAEHFGVELYPWHLVKAREIAFMPDDEAMLLGDIWDAYHALDGDFATGLCHLDMFADNTLWDIENETLTGLLDFTEVSIERFVMDLAITINDFCTNWGTAIDGEAVYFDTQKQQHFLHGYQSIRPLSNDERRALPLVLAQAAATFWLLRLNVIYYNRMQGRKGDDIMVKNPDLMKRLAAYHWGQYLSQNG